MASDKDKLIEMTDPTTGDDASNTARGRIPTTSTAGEHDCTGEGATAGDISPPPVSSSTPLDLERVHILLTYSTLLALTRDTSRPVVDLYMEAQVRQLDAFLAGDITEDGVATHWSAESKSVERLWQYERLCNELVPTLTAAIKKQSRINLKEQPKNRVNGDQNPEHQSFCELYLTPNLVTMYGKLVEKSRRKGTITNPDIDPWTDAVKYGKLIQLFQTIYGHQYDFENWKHTRPEPVFNQKPRLKAEEFMRMMGNRDQIQVYHCITTPLGRVFSQLDTIPEVPITYNDKQLAKMWRDRTRPRYLIPDPATITVPTKRRDIIWTNPDGVGKTWTRGNSKWSANFKFMVFDKATDAYIRDFSVSEDLLDQIDLNDETWVNRYRKKIAQWRGRATGESTRVRDHWNDEERVVVFQFANYWVKKNGIDKFIPRIWEGEKHSLMATLVNKTGHARTAESIFAWSRRQMVDKPNEPLGLLYAKGKNVATSVDAGVTIPHEERYPNEAIDIADFLANTQPKKSSKYRKYGPNYNTKRKRDSDDDSAADDDIMNDPENLNLDFSSEENVDLAMETGNGGSDDGDPPSSSLKPSKRPKLAAKVKKFLDRADREQGASFAKPKSLTKAEN
ncbi:hypothetical protein G6011_11767 [Alternaria panax]|uniref:Uncharacterized protein n=1 Tax=Alternaria panax TaxID=48097 RepID=A0AAD4F843_9PLEO|nr:hypothetical protein G6011_11767 [Alternaria panax]